VGIVAWIFEVGIGRGERVEESKVESQRVQEPKSARVQSGGS
jgi:hypothetical protein